MKGIVKNYNTSKKFGFISDEDNKDYFFHISNVQSMKELRKGQIVEFQPSTHVKGLRAVEIHLNFPFTQRDCAMISKYLINLMEKKQISKRYLARLSNVPEDAISKFEKNQFSLLYSNHNDIILNLKNITKALNITYIDLLIQVGFFTEEDLNHPENLIQSNFFTKEDVEAHKQFHSKKVKLTEREVIRIYYPKEIDGKIFENFEDAKEHLKKKGYVCYNRSQNIYAKVLPRKTQLGDIINRYVSFTEIRRFIEPV